MMRNHRITCYNSIKKSQYINIWFRKFLRFQNIDWQIQGCIHVTFASRLDCQVWILFHSSQHKYRRLTLHQDQNKNETVIHVLLKPNYQFIQMWLLWQYKDSRHIEVSLKRVLIKLQWYYAYYVALLSFYKQMQVSDVRSIMHGALKYHMQKKLLHISSVIGRFESNWF